MTLGLRRTRVQTGAAVRPHMREKGTHMPGEIGEVAPDFTLPSTSEGDITLSQYRGRKHVILSFHVFDFTSG
jgi:peroxiredoxin